MEETEDISCQNCLNGSSEIVQLLLENGANPNMKMSNGQVAEDLTDNSDIKNLIRSFIQEGGSIKRKRDEIEDEEVSSMESAEDRVVEESKVSGEEIEMIGPLGPPVGYVIDGVAAESVNEVDETKPTIIKVDFGASRKKAKTSTIAEPNISDEDSDEES